MILDADTEKNNILIRENRELNNKIKKRLDEIKVEIGNNIWKEIRNYKNEKYSNLKSFFIGSIPGLLEPIGGIIGVLLSTILVSYMPIILAFAAGTIIITVVDEIIPEYNSSSYKNFGTIGFVFGFLLLLMLDIILK
ncbi:hypothetical protein SFB3_076G0 [Candidatus Arthromitus sp. SFB-3]|nr:hypothetical protein SFB3_076G0 [Candidatus Arthromitus sp. SFB-3]